MAIKNPNDSHNYRDEIHDEIEIYKSLTPFERRLSCMEFPCQNNHHSF